MNVEQYQRLLAAAAVIFYTVELESGRIRKMACSGATEALIGYRPEAWPPDRIGWRGFLPREDRRQLIGQAAAMLAGGTSSVLEHRLVHRDGSLRWVRNIMVPRLGGQEKVVAIDGLVVDITEQQELRDQLRHAQRIEAVGQLSLGISHDFNNILTVVLGFTELVKMRLSGDGQLQGYLDRILTVAGRGRDLVRQILAFCRSGAEERQPLEIRYVIKEAVHLLRALLPASIKIEEQIEQQPAMVLAGPVEIHQVVMNLAINAWHAMPKGGLLRILLCSVTLPESSGRSPAHLPGGDYLCLEITDTGDGISPDILPQIFRPHFTTKKPRDGSGLGLFMVREIVTALGGGIIVESRAGAGSTFRVFLPRTSGDGQTREAVDADAPCGAARILVADDDPQVLAATEQVLIHFGHQVTRAESGAAALEAVRLRPGQFDLLLLNQSVPGPAGLEAAAEARRLEPRVPIVIMSGFAEPVARHRLGELGINEIIVKPVTARELGRSIGRILQSTS